MNDETNKKSNILMIVILIVMLILCGITSYLAFNLGKESEKTKEPEVTNKTESENKEEEKTPEEDNEQEEPKQPVEEENNVATNNTEDYSKYILGSATLFKTEDKHLTVNGNKHTITHIYSYTVSDELSQEGDGYIKYYRYYLTVLYDGKLTNVFNMMMNDNYFTLDSSLREKQVQVKVIKDAVNNKEYIAMAYIAMRDAGGVTDSKYYAAIIDEKNDTLYQYRDETMCDAMMDNVYPIEIIDNYIVVLDEPILSDSNSDTVTQRKISMENGESKHEILKEIDGKLFQGECQYRCSYN